MKIFTKKIFLLAIGMILSVGAYAQDAITHHWPELRFTIVKADGTPTDGVTYHIPGWDAWHRFPKGNFLYVYSHLRVQKYEKTGVDPTTGKDVFKARLVTRYIVSPDNRLTVPELKSSASAAPIWVKFVGHEEIGVKNIRGLKYSDVFETTYNAETEHNEGPDGTNYDVAIIDEDLDTKIIVTSGTLAIPAQMTHAASGEIYNIDEIGDYALRQYARTPANRKYNYVQASKLIIPKEITKIGRGAFFNNCHTTEIEFEEGSTIKDIPEFNFQDNTYLETITFPASIEKLYGTVLGGCPALQKIIFKGENPPTLVPFTWNDVERDVFESTTSASATVPEKCVIEFPLQYAAGYVSSATGTFLKEKKFALSSPVTMSSSGYTTCCSPLDFTVKQYNTTGPSWDNSDLKAFYVESGNVKETSVTLTDIDQGTKISAGEGVVLKGTASTSYGLFFPYANSQPSSLTDLGTIDNSLVGVTVDDPITIDPDYSYYILNGGKFRQVTKSGTIKANKAYLKIGGGTGAPVGEGTQNVLSINLSEETGITNMQAESVQNHVFYNLQGIQVKQPQKGIFIKNGKKYVIK